MLNSRVGSVRDGYVKVINKQGDEAELPFGACVWATGIAMNPLIKTLQVRLVFWFLFVVWAVLVLVWCVVFGCLSRRRAP